MKKTKRNFNFDDELINNLSILGLNKYESSIWLALLTKNGSTASELSEIANVPRSRSYDVLESLEKKGFVFTKIGKPIKYLAVSPEQVLNKVKKNIELESIKKITSVDDVKNSKLFTELNSLSLLNQNFDNSVVLLKGRLNAYNTINEILLKSKSSVIISTTKDGFLRKLNFFSNTIKNLSKKNINITFLTPKLNEDLKLKIKNEFSFNHLENDKISIRAIIIDNKHVFIGIDDKEEKLESFDQILYITSDYLANSLKNILL